MVDEQPERFLELMKYLYSGHSETIEQSRDHLAVFGVEIDDK